MQKHQMKFAMLIGIISFSSCGSLPKKPSVDSGIVIADINEAFFVNNRTGNEYSKQICINNEVNPFRNY